MLLESKQKQNYRQRMKVNIPVLLVTKMLGGVRTL